MEKNERFAAQYHPGEIVYVMYRNPHTQDVTNVQEAAVVENPELPGELCLFLYETYYPIDDELAIYKTKQGALEAYEYYFGTVEDGDLNA